MKGVIFTQFLEMVEEKHGIDVVDQIIDESDLGSGGAYTSVGNYDHGELVTIVKKTAKETGEPLEDLMVNCGRNLFDHFLTQYDDLIGIVDSTMDLLERVENFIHPEVMKLYPDAHPPSFVVELREENRMIFVYRSRRGLSLVAEGLIRQAMQHFEENLQILRESLEEDGSVVRFTISRVPA